MLDETPVFDAAHEGSYLEILRKAALDACEGLACEVFLFGSRATGQARRASDFDVGIRGLGPADFARVKRAIEDFVEDGPIPHGVDVVDFEVAGEPFKSAALEGRIVWKKG